MIAAAEPFVKVDKDGKPLPPGQKRGPLRRECSPKSATQNDELWRPTFSIPVNVRGPAYDSWVAADDFHHGRYRTPTCCAMCGVCRHS